MQFHQLVPGQVFQTLKRNGTLSAGAPRMMKIESTSVDLWMGSDRLCEGVVSNTVWEREFIRNGVRALRVNYLFIPADAEVVLVAGGWPREYGPGLLKAEDPVVPLDPPLRRLQGKRFCRSSGPWMGHWPAVLSVERSGKGITPRVGY